MTGEVFIAILKGVIEDKKKIVDFFDWTWHLCYNFKNNSYKHSVGEVADYKILQRVVSGEKRHKDFKRICEMDPQASNWKDLNSLSKFWRPFPPWKGKVYRYIIGYTRTL